MIVRTWRGATQVANADTYVPYLLRTGIAEYEATSGNLGTLLLQRSVGEREEFLILSFWGSLDAVRGFAGDDLGRAAFYPEDDAFLIERDVGAVHWEIGHSSMNRADR